MLIKSKSLLPMISLTDEEEANIHDLEARLVTYAKIKELASGLKAIFGQQIIFEKNPHENAIVVFSPDAQTDVSNILTALERVITSLPKKEVLSKLVVKKVISLEEMIEKLAERISQASKINFQEFCGPKGVLTYEQKVSVIVGFLAMLELIKRGAIRVSQEGRGDIEMESEAVGTPMYL
jgi:chromatin segregation and condensation protein Rec8/ScpA/Scc1 (kleisin family)